MTYQSNARSMYWVAECNYISKIANVKGKVREMNNDTDTFIRYCEMQRQTADAEGFHDTATYNIASMT